MLLQNLEEYIAHRPLLGRAGHLDSRVEGFREFQRQTRAGLVFDCRRWVRSHAERLAGAARLDESTDMHVHLAEAARWKDGPSAGVALAAALVSALTGQPARSGVAMTGELTLAGTVEPVGGIREKVLGACRARMAAVVLPVANEADIAESFGGELPGGITVHYARTMDDVLEMVLPDLVV